MKISLPSRGQPIDVNYIYQLADAINNVAVQASASTNKYVTVQNRSDINQDLQASESRMVAAYVAVANNSTVSAGNEMSFSLSYSGFKYEPIATATPINIGGTDAGKDISVVLKSTTTSKLEGVVKFKSSGDVSVGVNIILIGIPN
jgi:hypothetical protein